MLTILYKNVIDYKNDTVYIFKILVTIILKLWQNNENRKIGNTFES